MHSEGMHPLPPPAKFVPAPRKEPVPPEAGVGESSKRLRPWVWIVGAVDIAVSLFFLGRFFYKLGSGYTMNTHDVLLLMFGLFITFVSLTFQLVMGILMILSLKQDSAPEAARYCNVWLYCSYIVNIFAVVLVFSAVLKPEMSLVLVAAGFIIFRAFAHLIVIKFSKSLTNDSRRWETQRRTLEMDMHNSVRYQYNNEFAQQQQQYLLEQQQQQQGGYSLPIMAGLGQSGHGGGYYYADVMPQQQGQYTARGYNSQRHQS